MSARGQPQSTGARIEHATKDPNSSGYEFVQPPCIACRGPPLDVSQLISQLGEDAPDLPLLGVWQVVGLLSHRVDELLYLAEHLTAVSAAHDAGVGERPSNVRGTPSHRVQFRDSDRRPPLEEFVSSRLRSASSIDRLPGLAPRKNAAPNRDERSDRAEPPEPADRRDLHPVLHGHGSSTTLMPALVM